LPIGETVTALIGYKIAEGLLHWSMATMKRGTVK